MTVTTLGLLDPPHPVKHHSAREAWADYKRRISALEAAGYQRGRETGRYGGTEWTQPLKRGTETVTVRLEAPPR